MQVNNAWAGLSPLHIFFNTDNIGSSSEHDILEANVQDVDKIVSFARCFRCVNTDS